jgi:hypothetical protein
MSATSAVSMTTSLPPHPIAIPTLAVARAPGKSSSRWGALALTLQSSLDLDLETGDVSVSLDQGQDLILVMTVADRGPAVFIQPSVALELLESTDRWWREWAKDCWFEGRFRTEVIRSSITLRLRSRGR